MILPWSKPDYPDFIWTYLDKTPNRLSRKIPLESLKFIALDIEASGFQIGTDRMLSISLLTMTHQEIQLDQCWEWTVFQPDIGTNQATEIHGIMPAETRGGTPEKEVLEAIIPLLTGAVVIGHSLRFDADLLDEAFRRHFQISFRNSMYDTSILAMHEFAPFKKTKYLNQKSPSLEDLCAHLGLPTIDRHTAEGDAFLAAQIFLLMMARKRRRLNRTLRASDFPVGRL